MSEETPDQKHGKQLGVHFETVRVTRERFNDDTIIQHVLKERILMQIEECRTKLESVKVEDFQRVQGEIKGLRKAIAVILQKN